MAATGRAAFELAGWRDSVGEALQVRGEPLFYGGHGVFEGNEDHGGAQVIDAYYARFGAGQPANEAA